MPRAYGITNTAPYASAPTIGAAGDTYFNTTDKSLYVSDGAVWIALPSGTVDTAEITDGAVTRAKLATGASYNLQGDFLPINFTTATINADVAVKTLPALTTRGGRVRVEINVGGYLAAGTGAFFRYYVFRNSVSVHSVRWSAYTPGGAGWIPTPSLLYWDAPAAGTWTYEFRMLQSVANLFNTAADSAGTFYVVEAA